MIYGPYLLKTDVGRKSEHLVSWQNRKLRVRAIWLWKRMEAGNAVAFAELPDIFAYIFDIACYIVARIMWCVGDAGEFPVFGVDACEHDLDENFVWPWTGDGGLLELDGGVNIDHSLSHKLLHCISYVGGRSFELFL
jgi:hypothetical protein